MDVRHLSDGTLTICDEKVPSRNAGGVGFVDRLLSILSIRMRSYHFAWLPLDSVLYITITIIHYYSPTSGDNSQLDAFCENSEEVIR
ncbi:unnamed protein product [Strongylus vulgaris]|uniref:Uncharacterized protein n=1 Tax=Strongylus vulgaris TaxID=40348 RepID=A0A3P7K8D4_STRVU|nr:unnamed protein product [Strongylus vulgaris]